MLDLRAVRMGPNAPARRNRLVAHRQRLEAGVGRHELRVGLDAGFHFSHRPPARACASRLDKRSQSSSASFIAEVIEIAMKRPTKELLAQMQATFPAFEWSDAELDDLVRPGYGLITGFPELLIEIERLCERDLEVLSPAGALPAPGSS